MARQITDSTLWRRWHDGGNCAEHEIAGKGKCPFHGQVRYRTELTGETGRVHTTYRDAPDAREAARLALLGWRSDGPFNSPLRYTLFGEVKPLREGTDLYGDYQEFTARAGRRFASVKVRR
jgi:hypothetical protein